MWLAKQAAGEKKVNFISCKKSRCDGSHAGFDICAKFCIVSFVKRSKGMEILIDESILRKPF